MSTSTTFATNPNLYKTLPFNVQTDFAPVTLTAFIPNLLVVNPSVPASNVAEFIAYLKANPGKLNFGSAGNGSSQHIAGELFNSLSGGRMMHIAYRGGALAVNDMLGGQLQVIFAPLVEVLQLVRTEKVKRSASPRRSGRRCCRRLPTIAETLPGYEDHALERIGGAGENPA